jgi:hypothetical protein
MKASPGFTYLEVLIAVVVLAGAVVTASGALISAKDRDREQSQMATAKHLLEDGVAIVMRLPRLDESAPVFGREAGESTDDNPADVDDLADDVDDLARVVQVGPTDLSGLVHGAAWERRWTVQSVALDDLGVAGDGSTPLMQVRISILYQGNLLLVHTFLLARTP